MTPNNFSELVSYLKDKKLTIGSVESMTGGLFASLITEVPGASKVYRGSLITYHCDLKSSLANVDPKLIDKHGVVSKEVADAMALGGLKALDVDVSISVTGNAGPTVEPGDMPVGTMFISVAYLDKVFDKCVNIKGSRNEVRLAASYEMAKFTLECLKK